LPNNVRDALAGESLRPRVSRMGDGTLITLRCINGSTDERPDQLVAMRVYMDDGLIVPPDSVKFWRWMTSSTI
jgi:zinc transporter